MTDTNKAELLDPDLLQRGVQAAAEKFQARRGLWILLGLLVLAAIVAVAIFANRKPDARDSAFDQLSLKSTAAQMELSRGLSARAKIAEVESFADGLAGEKEEGLALWTVALLNYAEAYTEDKIGFAARKPFLEKAEKALARLESEKKFRDLILAKGQWYSSNAKSPVLAKLEQVRADLAFGTSDPVAPQPSNDLRAVLRTSDGDIWLQFFKAEAPQHVKNFTTLAKAGAYNGTAFHFAKPGLETPDAIAGGDPYSYFYPDSLKKEHLLRWGQGGAGYDLPPESARYKVPHERGIVTTQRQRRADWDNAVQFQILLARVEELDAVHTPFAKVVEGLDVLDKIAKRKRAAQHEPFQDDRDFNGEAERNLFVEPARIHKVIIFESGSAAKHAFPLTDAEQKVATVKNAAVEPLEGDALRADRTLVDPQAAEVKVEHGRTFPFPLDVDLEKAEATGERDS